MLNACWNLMCMFCDWGRFVFCFVVKNEVKNACFWHVAMLTRICCCNVAVVYLYYMVLQVCFPHPSKLHLSSAEPFTSMNLIYINYLESNQQLAFTILYCAHTTRLDLYHVISNMLCCQVTSCSSISVHQSMSNQFTKGLHNL